MNNILNSLCVPRTGGNEDALFINNVKSNHRTREEAFEKFSSRRKLRLPLTNHNHSQSSEWALQSQQKLVENFKSVEKGNENNQLNWLRALQWRVIDEALDSGLNDSVKQFSLGASSLFSISDDIGQLKNAFHSDNGHELKSGTDVLYIAISYSHRQYKDVDEFLQNVHNYLNDALPPGIPVCLWIDKIFVRRSRFAATAKGNDYIPWTLVGLFPYALTFVAPLTRTELELKRLWISIEHTLAAYGLGLLLSRKTFREQIDLLFYGPVSVWSDDEDNFKLVGSLEGPEVSLRSFCARFLAGGYRSKDVTYEEDRRQIQCWATYIAVMHGSERLVFSDISSQTKHRSDRFSAVQAAALYDNITSCGAGFECRFVDRILKFVEMDGGWDGYLEWLPLGRGFKGTDVGHESSKRFGTYWHVITVRNGARVAIGDRANVVKFESRDALMVFLDRAGDSSLSGANGRVHGYLMNYGYASNTLKVLRHQIARMKYKEPPEDFLCNNRNVGNYGYHYEEQPVEERLDGILVQELVKAIVMEWSVITDLDIVRIELVHDDQICWT